MSVGLPGSGLGGVFYLLSALLMPIDGALRSLRRGHLPRARLVARQLSLALAIVAALVVTGWAIERLILSLNGSALAIATGAVVHGTAIPRMLRAATFALTFGTLGVVLLAVQILRLFFAVRTTTADVKEGTERRAA